MLEEYVNNITTVAKDSQDALKQSRDRVIEVKEVQKSIKSIASTLSFDLVDVP